MGRAFIAGRDFGDVLDARPKLGLRCSQLRERICEDVQLL